jgi:hypothetical protein
MVLLHGPARVTFEFRQSGGETFITRLDPAFSFRQPSPIEEKDARG